MPIIQTRNLRKVFRTVKRRTGALGALATLFTREYVERVAVEGVTMSLEAGELVGYIGPNGAGKSTTIKMLTGILVPTSGEIVVAGLVPYRERKRNARNIGVVFGQRSQLYWDLPLVESFELLRAIYNAATWRPSSTCWRWATFCRRPCASSRSASACAATSRVPCSTIRRSSTSTNRRSGSTSSQKKRFVNSSRG
jgi:ABC-type branched-subunit amino acid transport system ATPase component